MTTTPLTPETPPAEQVIVAGPPRLRSRWYLTLPLMIAIATLAIFAWQAPPDGSQRGDDLYRFLGRFHPSLTHFPIGLLILMPILDVFGVFRRARHLWATGQLVMWLATLGMIFAAAAGYLLARYDGHGGEDMLDHQWAGIASAAWCCFALLFRSLARGGNRRMIWGFLYVIALLFTLISLTFAGHLGGKSVHGDDYLTEYAPPPVREAFEKLEGIFDDEPDHDIIPSTQPTRVPATMPTTTPVTIEPPRIEPAPIEPAPTEANTPREPTAPTTAPATTEPATTEPAAALPAAAVPLPAPGDPLPAPADRNFFASVVQPIFVQHCVECHGPKKIKGDLRLDSFAHTMKGGTSESTVVPGSLSDSELVRLIKLPADHDDVMPPEKSPRLTADEIEAITWWIQQGASETQPVDAENVPANLKALAK